MKPSEILREAIKLIEVHGWVQGHSGSQEEGFCMVGAVNEMLKHPQYPFLNHCANAKRTAFKALRFEVPNSSITCYNDAPDRTKQQVLGVIEKAAIKLEVEGN